MKQLLLLRHAKAAPLVGGDDYNRELTEGGEFDAACMGDLIAAEGLQADVVVSSGARRASETARIVAGRWSEPVAARIESALYDATRHLILALLRELPDTASSALIVGHNPGIGDMANLITGDGDRSTRLRMASKFPPCALAAIAFRGEWSGLSPRLGKLEIFVTPEDFATP